VTLFTINIIFCLTAKTQWRKVLNLIRFLLTALADSSESVNVWVKGNSYL